MLSPTAARDGAARALLRREARALRLPVLAPVLLGLAAILCGIAGAWLAARLLAAVLGHGAAGAGTLAAAAALALLGAALGLAQERSQLRAGEAARARLRAAAFARLLAAGPADARGVGEKAALVVDRVEALDGYFARWLPAARLALLGPALVALAAALADPASGLILLLAGLLVPAAMAVTGIGAAQASRRQFDQLQNLSGRFLDRMRGLSTLVLFNRQEAEAEALAQAAGELRRRTLRVLRVAFLSVTALDLLAAGALALVALRHAALLGGVPAGHPGPAAAIFTLLLVPAFFAPLRGFSAAYHERLSAAGAAAALAPLLEAEPAPGLRLEALPPRVVVTFTDVRLSYDPARPPALDGLSFRANAGETLVLSGPSGAGKSSVLRLLMGFVRPDSGRIAINGQDATALRPEELRRLSAYVGQRAHLFRASIRENIRFARPEATDAEVEAAAEAARVTGFAAALPQGLDTLVGEGGWGLSGGQAQRVALARAFLRNAPLVLLDEPTAHLDPGTEAEVLESLRRLCLGRTAIIASHAAAARSLGRVVEMEQGRAVTGPRAAKGAV
ncbi:thiol reductant ABC exporter subunit CydD [Crenalkalicoccus roseus]|uniref:thiol reductant ABC exporter subunit CydD n=1 Tax=Crenalkalicoccus roseus TaxID=1485588 RepID=UPI0010803DC4|nr:thiol reductant ABC exporter subunit CydD [Crenalkalicoccus roseus]